MVKLLLFLYTCLINLACLDTGQRFKVKAATKEVTKATILWTIDFSPDGQFFAIGGDDGLLKIYNASNHKLLNSYNLLAAVQCVDWNQGKLLAIALDDKPVRLLNMETGNFQVLNETTGSRSLAWNYNGQLLAIGDYEGSLLIFSKEGILLKSIKKDNNKTYLTVDWHPKKNIILTGSDKIRIFDTTGNLLYSIKHRPEETPILTVKWHPDGLFFATGDYGEKENKIESLLQFWNINGTLMKSLHGSNAEYRNIRWNKSGNRLATASDALRLWSEDGKIIYSGDSKNLLWGIDWDNSNRTIITTSNNGSVKLWTDKAMLLKDIKN